MYINNCVRLNLSSIDGFNELLNNDVETNTLKKNNVKLADINNNYKVIHYDKNLLTSDLVSTTGLCRSVIANKDNNVVSFSPPKSLSYDSFTKKYELPNNHIFAEEFVEGTMINVFWDPSVGLNGGWEIATRNSVGAHSRFFKNINSNTFRTMFLEAAKENNLIIENLKTDFCYSFVLQHPENRIVVPFKKSQLYLIGVYRIDNTDKNNIKVYVESMQNVRCFDWYLSSIQFPENYSFNSYDELKQKYASMNTHYSVVGVIIYNSITGERTKIRNPVYEEVKSLRGNQPKLQYQYLCLRKEGKVREFLKFYPEYIKEFSNFRTQVHTFTKTLFSNYCLCYIKKTNPLIEFGPQYRTHMFNIHKIFMDELREKKMFITNTNVIKYVNELHPTLLMYCLNYNMRKRVVDFVSIDDNRI